MNFICSIFSSLQNINVAHATDVFVVRGSNEWKLFLSPEVHKTTIFPSMLAI